MSLGDSGPVTSGMFSCRRTIDPAMGYAVTHSSFKQHLGNLVYYVLLTITSVFFPVEIRERVRLDVGMEP